MALFESYERRIDKINGVLAQYGIGSVEECRDICKARGFDPYEIVKEIQPICFENACWAYTVGAAIALKSGVKTAAPPWMPPTPLLPAKPMCRATMAIPMARRRCWNSTTTCALCASLVHCRSWQT